MGRPLDPPLSSVALPANGCLKIHPKKSKLAFGELEYLGYTMSRGRLRTQMKKVKTIMTAARHRTKKQL